VLSDGVAGENCIVYHNGTANYLTWKEYTTLQTLQIQVLGEIRTQEVVSTENLTLDMEDKTL
jgi:hypothetical protein